MRIVIITSCTGKKHARDERALTDKDFEQGPEHVARREHEFADLLTLAADLYSGQQHVRLLRGIRAARARHTHGDPTFSLDLHILSAGYGLVPDDRLLAPYECTFQGMPLRTLRRVAARRNIPGDIRRVLADPYNLALLLLGDSYLEACALDDMVHLGGLTIALCGTEAYRRLPHLPHLRVVTLSNPEAKRFSCGIIGLKGELAARLLSLLNADALLLDHLHRPETDVLALLDRPEDKRQPVRRVAQPNAGVDHIITIPDTWW